jgi:hypothetical protein
MVRKIKAFLQTHPRPSSHILRKSDILPNSETLEFPLLDQALKQLCYSHSLLTSLEENVDEMDLASIPFPQHLNLRWLADDVLHEATVYLCTIFMAVWFGFPFHNPKSRRSMEVTKRGQRLAFLLYW